MDGWMDGQIDGYKYYTRVFARFARKTSNTVGGAVDGLGAVDIFAQGHKITLVSWTWKMKIIYLILYHSPILTHISYLLKNVVSSTIKSIANNILNKGFVI